MLRKTTVALAIALMLGGAFIATDALAAEKGGGGSHGGGGHGGGSHGGGHVGHGGGACRPRRGSRPRRWRIWRCLRWLLRSGLRVWRLPSGTGANCWLLVTQRVEVDKPEALREVRGRNYDGRFAGYR